MKTTIQTHNAPAGTNFYSQAIQSNGFIFVAGQLHMNPDGKMVEGSIEEKLAQIMKNISAILQEAGLGLEHVVKTTVYVTDITILKELNPLYAGYFPKDPPAREAVCVKELPLGASIEVSVIAATA